MNHHPLLLSTCMVHAYLADRKFVTRRIPGSTNSFVNGKRVSGKKWKALEFDLPNYEIKDGAFWFFSGSTQEWYKVTPIYEPGDWLWFRETFIDGNDYPCCNCHLDPEDEDYQPRFGYKADCPPDQQKSVTWRPSIHMPKSAARLWAEVTTVSCERIQDITEEQAGKEGVDWRKNPDDGQPNFKNYEAGCGTFDFETAAASFRSLWASIHGWENWTANPPVYAINFNPLSKTGMPGNH